ncbi:MAG: hypothetical protein CMH56_16100 [Myxococcales bacterium]|nr:hypothetical protein [Myxococcales bacterium]
MTDEKSKDETQPQKRSPYRVGGPLNHFGTRRRRRIECQACGKTDYVSFVPKEGQKVYCGTCAREELSLYEEGEEFPTEANPVVCPECSRTFNCPSHIPVSEDLLCPDCFKGFETWKGAKGGSQETKNYEKGPSGTILRRKAKSKPET